MPEKKSARRPRSQTIEVARVVSIGRSKIAGDAALVKLRDSEGGMVVLRLLPQQLKTLALGLAGMSEALDQ